jgi:UDP-2,3-diacylglucosamine hydrolase
VKKIYFASDMHLGHPNHKQAFPREKLFVKWLDEIKSDAAAIYLVGDIFDFWYEYRKVVPRGFTRFLGKIAEITDSGVPVHFFTGNHDVWMFDYLQKELGVEVHYGPVETMLMGKSFYIAHGDGLGPGDPGFRLLKKVFTSKSMQFLFSRLHPNFAFWLGHSWSNSSRYSKGLEPLPYQGDDKELLFLHSANLLKTKMYDFLIYGHRHLVVQKPIGGSSQFIILGDWLWNFSCGVFDGNSFELKRIAERP